eukprot:6212320-Pleurochrysis_carterae.AAC.4
MVRLSVVGALAAPFFLLALLHLTRYTSSHTHAATSHRISTQRKLAFQRKRVAAAPSIETIPREASVTDSQVIGTLSAAVRAVRGEIALRNDATHHRQRAHLDGGGGTFGDQMIQSSTTSVSIETEEKNVQADMVPLQQKTVQKQAVAASASTDTPTHRHAGSALSSEDATDKVLSRAGLRVTATDGALASGVVTASEIDSKFPKGQTIWLTFSNKAYLHFAQNWYLSVKDVRPRPACVKPARILRTSKRDLAAFRTQKLESRQSSAKR